MASKRPLEHDESTSELGDHFYCRCKRGAYLRTFFDRTGSGSSDEDSNGECRSPLNQPREEPSTSYRSREEVSWVVESIPLLLRLFIGCVFRCTGGKEASDEKNQPPETASGASGSPGEQYFLNFLRTGEST